VLLPGVQRGDALAERRRPELQGGEALAVDRRRLGGLVVGRVRRPRGLRALVDRRAEPEQRRRVPARAPAYALSDKGVAGRSPTTPRGA
jgi:hypothetical protein